MADSTGKKHQKLDMAPFFDYRIDIHHIFPKAWCDKNGVSPVQRESIVNKTAISASTNRSVGGRAPSSYLKTLETSAGIGGDALDAVVQTHLIDTTALRSDDFASFFARRSESLLGLIASAMGKAISRDDQSGEGDPAAFEEITELDFELEEGPEEGGGAWGVAP